MCEFSEAYNDCKCCEGEIVGPAGNIGDGDGDGDDSAWLALVGSKGKCNVNGACFSDAKAIAQSNFNGAMAAIVGTEGKYHGKSIRFGMTIFHRSLKTRFMSTRVCRRRSVD